ncbi:MAG: hypothetical protein VX899_21790 [Myxococcota bacterium]|nr:hypothetical protein [Myxococcota bacterium]
MFLLLCGLASASEVTLSGTITWSGAGPVRIEALSEDENGQLLLVAEAVLSGPGHYELTLPSGAGAVRLRAGTDPELDGLDPRAAMGLYPGVVQVGEADVSGLNLQLAAPRATPGQ